MSREGKVLLSWVGEEDKIEDDNEIIAKLKDKSSGSLFVFHTHTNDTTFSEKDYKTLEYND